MDPFEFVIALFMFGMPVIGIVGYYYNRRKRLEIEHEKVRQLQLPSPQTDQLREDFEKMRNALAYTLTENEQLKHRLENLETIVTSVEWDEVTKQKHPEA